MQVIEELKDPRSSIFLYPKGEFEKAVFLRKAREYLRGSVLEHLGLSAGN